MTYSIQYDDCLICLCQTNCHLLLADIEDLEHEIRELTGQMGLLSEGVALLDFAGIHTLHILGPKKMEHMAPHEAFVILDDSCCSSRISFPSLNTSELR